MQVATSGVSVAHEMAYDLHVVEDSNSGEKRIAFGELRGEYTDNTVDNLRDFRDRTVACKTYDPNTLAGKAKELFLTTFRGYVKAEVDGIHVLMNSNSIAKRLGQECVGKSSEEIFEAAENLQKKWGGEVVKEKTVPIGWDLETSRMGKLISDLKEGQDKIFTVNYDLKTGNLSNKGTRIEVRVVKLSDGTFRGKIRHFDQISGMKSEFESQVAADIFGQKGIESEVGEFEVVGGGQSLKGAWESEGLLKSMKSLVPEGGSKDFTVYFNPVDFTYTMDNSNGGAKCLVTLSDIEGEKFGELKSVELPNNQKFNAEQRELFDKRFFGSQVLVDDDIGEFEVIDEDLFSKVKGAKISEETDDVDENYALDLEGDWKTNNILKVLVGTVPRGESRTVKFYKTQNGEYNLQDDGSSLKCEVELVNDEGDVTGRLLNASYAGQDISEEQFENFENALFGYEG